MYRILVADDEQLERMVLGQALASCLGQHCEIEYAVNGREAVEVALRIEADIIFMDIEMPGMNGLEAAKTIAHSLPQCKIVMLTAYSKFDYAREAIGFGAAEYLLKPCSDEELWETLELLTGQIDAQRAQAREQMASREAIANLTAQMEEQLVLTIMGGHSSPTLILQQLAERGIHFAQGIFVLLQGEEKLSTASLCTVARQTRWPAATHPFLYEYDGCVYLLCLSTTHSEGCLEWVESTLTQLMQQSLSLWGAMPLVGMGAPFYNMADAQLSCFQAKIALGRCTPQSPLTHFTCEQQDIQPHSIEESLLDSILSGNKQLLSQMVTGLLDGYRAVQMEYDTIVSSVESRLNTALDLLGQRHGIGWGLTIDLSAQKHVSQDLNALHQAIVETLGRISQEMEVAQQDHLSVIRQNIAQYIEENYHRDIFLQTVAKEMNYSDTYFSKLFKQCFAQNFISYLTDIRISAAKKLLQDKSLTVRQVGEKVGYSDPNYFTKVFRKAVSSTPSEYRGAVLSRYGSEQ